MKTLVAVTLAMLLLVTFAVPVLADQPEEPGCFGGLVTELAQNDGPGASSEMHQAKVEAEELAELGILTKANLGRFLEVIRTDHCGIPPKHSA